VADFLSALVHEARTPLTALHGALSLMAAEDAPDPGTVREFGSIALRNAKKLVHLLDDLAVYARLRNPEFATHTVPVADLSHVFEDAAGRVQPVAETRGVTVSVQLVPFGVVADESQLKDAVARLIFYAVRVTPLDGLVTVSAEIAAGRVVVRVADQGRPLTEDLRREVFEPFSPTARRGVDSADRAGLDLAIAKLVAERHDGTIEYLQTATGGVVRLTLGDAYTPTRG